MFRVSSFTFVLQVFVVEMKGFERFTVSTLKLSIVFFVAWVYYVTVLVLQSCFEMLCALVVIFNFRLCFLFLIFCIVRVTEFLSETKD